MAISSNGLQLVRIAGAVFNQQLSASDYSEILAANKTAAELDAWANAAVAAEFRNKTTTDIAKAVLTNVGLTSVAGLENWVVGQLNAGGGVAKAGQTMLAMLNDYSNMSTTEAIYGASVTTFNAKTANSQVLSQTAGTAGGTYAAVPTVVAVKPSTFVLTTGTNSFTGTSGNDTFDAGLSTSSLQTLNSGDSLDGGAGTDELFAVINGSVTPSAVKGIENIYITNTSTTAVANADFSNATGITSISNQSSTFGTTISGINTSVAVTVRDTTVATHTVTYTGVSGTADAATISLANVTGSAPTLTVAGIETLTLNPIGSTDSAIATLTTASTTKLVITGNTGLSLGTLGATVRTLDASANTGAATNVGITATFGATTALNVTGGAGNDALTLGSSTGDDSVSSGAGNDTIIFTANFTTADTVNGGDGATDDLRLIAGDLATASASTPATYNVTNFERISVSTALGSTTYIPANVSATVTTFNVRGALDTAITAGNNTITGPAGAFAIGLGQSSTAAAGTNDDGKLGANTLTITDTGSAITDTLTITNSATDASVGINVYNGTALTVTGYETVTLSTGSGAGVQNTLGVVTITGDIGGTSAERLNITGVNGVQLVGTHVLDIIDASALTATGTAATQAGAAVYMSAASGATTITGSGGFDILYSSASSSSVDGGAGADSITSGAGNDTILGGTGADTIIAAAGNDSIDAGAGNDRLEIGTGLATGDTLAGGDGTDTFAITGDVTDDAAAMSNVSGFEILEVASAATDTITMSNFTNNQGFTRVDFSDVATNTATVNNVPSTVTDVRILSGAIGDTLVFDRLIDNSTNSVTISSRTGANTAITLLTANDEETINFSGNSAADDLTLTNFNAADLKTLNITGDADFVVTAANAISSTLLATLDASASTGAVTVTNTSNAVQATVTGGSGVLTFSGGAAADSISGGSAGDFLNGGAGTDTINGNAGNDSITGGLGADVVNVGSGTDTFNLGSGNGVVNTSTSFGTAVSTTTNIAVTGSDVITGMGVGDKITFGTNSATAFDGIAAVTVGKIATAVLMTATTVDNSANLMRGSWIADSTTGSGTFIYNTAGADLMYVYDSDPTVGTLAFKSVVLVGVGGVVTGGAHAHNAGEITMTLS
jgi:Ca2+-binding RTX toxin-like protein